MPRRIQDRGFLEHVLDGYFVIRPALAVAKIFVRQLPALERIGETVLETANLLSRCDVKKAFDQPDTVIDHHLFELIDLYVGALPFGLAGKLLDPLDQDSPVPRAVKDHDLARPRQLLPKSLQIMPSLLMMQWSGDRINLEAARIQGPAQPADDAALAGRIPAFEYYDGSFPCTEISLLNRLHGRLHRLQAALIVGKHDPGMLYERRELRPSAQDEIFPLHKLKNHQLRTPRLDPHQMRFCGKPAVSPRA